ncbi:5088_t:CDS:2, partial [Racocetra persica]
MNFLANFDEAKNLILKIKAYSKDNEYDTKRVAKMLVEESKGGNSFDIESLTAVMESLKISRVKRKSDDNMQEIKDAMKQLTKVVTDLAIRSLYEENVERKEPDMQYIDMTEQVPCDEKIYLVIELMNNENDALNEELKDIKNLDKRSYQNLVEKRSKGSVMYIPLIYLTEDLDVLKTIADL